MAKCNMCRSLNLLSLINFGEHPIAHHFLKYPKQSEYRHSVDLRYCEECGLIQLVDPIPSEMLYTEYVCLSTWKNQPHIPRLINLIRDLPGLSKTSRIFEVGSNDGRFLGSLLAEGYKNCIGLEPAIDARTSAIKNGIPTSSGYFTTSTAADIVHQYGKFDLLIARQVLEHISDLSTFRDAMRCVLKEGAYVLIEVPNSKLNLSLLDYSIWEEHVNYFTLDTLRMFLSMVGLRIVHHETILFSGEALIVIAQYSETVEEESKTYLNTIRRETLLFSETWPHFKNRFFNYLSNSKINNDKIAIWGAGCRSCSLINFLEIAPFIEFIADDQPEKQGLFMPGSHLEILPSSELEIKKISLCLLAVNTENEELVISKHKKLIESGMKFFSILPPSNRLPPFWQI